MKHDNVSCYLHSNENYQNEYRIGMTIFTHQNVVGLLLFLLVIGTHLQYLKQITVPKEAEPWAIEVFLEGGVFDQFFTLLKKDTKLSKIKCKKTPAPYIKVTVSGCLSTLLTSLHQRGVSREALMYSTCNFVWKYKQTKKPNSFRGTFFRSYLPEYNLLVHKRGFY